MKKNLNNNCDMEKLVNTAIQFQFMRLLDTLDKGDTTKRKLQILAFRADRFLNMTVKIDTAKLEGYQLETFDNIVFEKYQKEETGVFAYFKPKTTSILKLLKQAVIISLKYTHHLETKKDMLDYLENNLNKLPNDTFKMIDQYYQNSKNIEDSNCYNGKHME